MFKDAGDYLSVPFSDTTIYNVLRSVEVWRIGVGGYPCKPIISDTTILCGGWWRMWEAVPILEPPHLEHLFSLSLPLMGEGGSDQQMVTLAHNMH